MTTINRTLFEAGVTKRVEETEEEFKLRLEWAWRLAERAMGIYPIEDEDDVREG